MTSFHDLTVTIAPNAKVRYSPAVAYNGPYTITSSNQLGSIEIREKNASTPLKKTTFTKSIQYRFEKNKLYDAYFHNNTSSFVAVTITLRPDHLITACSVYDIGINNLDSSYPITSITPDLESHDFYVRNYNNLGNNDFLSKKPFLSEICIISTHGSAGSVTLFNGLSDNSKDHDTFWYYDIPTNATNAKCTSWYSCHGATMTSGNYRTSMARESVVRGCDSSFGFDETIAVDYCDSHERFFLQELISGKSILEAARSSTEKTRKANWILSCFNYSLYTGKMYYRENGSIKWTSINYGTQEIHNDDGGTANTSLNVAVKDLTSYGKMQANKLPVYHDKAVTNLIVSEQDKKLFEKVIDDTFSETKWPKTTAPMKTYHKGLFFYDGALHPYLFDDSSKTQVDCYDLEKGEKVPLSEIYKHANHFVEWRNIQ